MISRSAPHQWIHPALTGILKQVCCKDVSDMFQEMLECLWVFGFVHGKCQSNVADALEIVTHVLNTYCDFFVF